MPRSFYAARIKEFETGLLVPANLGGGSRRSGRRSRFAEVSDDDFDDDESIAEEGLVSGRSSRSASANPERGRERKERDEQLKRLQAAAVYKRTRHQYQ